MSGLILAIDETGGLAKNGNIPWLTPAGRTQVAQRLGSDFVATDMRHFRQVTMAAKTVIMGYLTFLSLGQPLDQRVNIVIKRPRSTDPPPSAAESPNLHWVTSLAEAMALAYQLPGEALVIGGQRIFQQYLRDYRDHCTTLYVTVIPGDWECDQHLALTTLGLEPAQLEAGRIYQLPDRSPGYNPDERNYQQHLELLLTTGQLKTDRTGHGTLSIFSPEDLHFQLRNLDGHDVLPLLTTKKMAYNSIVQELLWFISGSTDSKVLEAAGCKIWRDNTSRAFLDARGLTSYREGQLGPGYGFQWRHSGAKYIDADTDYTGQGVDQLAYLLDGLRREPDSRRLVLSAWNPADLPAMALPPCHLLYQVWTSPADPLTHQRRLSAKVYMRSADSFLGVPFNIASYALLTHLLAQLTGHVADRLHLAFGDFHLYRHHVEAARTQLERTSRPFPKIRWNRPLLNTDIDHIRAEDFTIYDYFPHDRISAKMAI